jgi:hypothetical protein
VANQHGAGVIDETGSKLGAAHIEGERH